MPYSDTLVHYDPFDFCHFLPLIALYRSVLHSSLCIHLLSKLSLSALYLFSALPDQGDKLGDDQVDTFQTWVFELNDLLFHYGLKRHVWGEQACPVVMHHGSWRFNVR